ncbi:MAG: hypothetical protein IPM36_23940 [Lewinellaceae bacterium]|nr:hypothetical protein [Lewinellaceae bacterium]
MNTSAVALGLLDYAGCRHTVHRFYGNFSAYNSGVYGQYHAAASNYFTPVMASVLILMEGIAAARSARTSLSGRRRRCAGRSEICWQRPSYVSTKDSLNF